MKHGLLVCSPTTKDISLDYSKILNSLASNGDKKQCFHPKMCLIVLFGCICSRHYYQRRYLFMTILIISCSVYFFWSANRVPNTYCTLFHLFHFLRFHVLFSFFPQILDEKPRLQSFKNINNIGDLDINLAEERQRETKTGRQERVGKWACFYHNKGNCSIFQKFQYPKIELIIH